MLSRGYPAAPKPTPRLLSPDGIRLGMSWSIGSTHLSMRTASWRSYSVCWLNRAARNTALSCHNWKIMTPMRNQTMGRSSIEDRGQTNCWTSMLTLNFGFQSPWSYGYDQHTCWKLRSKVTRLDTHKPTCPRLPRWAGTRKVKQIWILLKQETVSSSGISWAICKSAPRSRQITMPAPHHSVFTGRMPFLPPNQQHQCIEGSRQFKS